MESPVPSGGPAPRRVLFISPQPYFEWRGSPIRVNFDVKALAELGFDVHLLAMPVGQEKPEPGVRTIKPPNLFRLRRLPIGPSFWKAVYDIILFFRAAGLVCVHRYDVIHGVEEAGVIAAVLGKLSGAKVVFERHSDPCSYRDGPLRNFIMHLYSRLEAFAIRHADAVIGTGRGLVEQARRIAPAKSAHFIFDIPSSLAPAEPGRVGEVRKTLQASPDERLVTYVGSFAVYQGIDLMFHAMPAVIARQPKTRFVIIGGSDGEIAERRRRLAEQKIEASVSCIGKVPPDELPNYLAASDVLLSPRLAGANTPMKTLDYMKAGRAIVAADVEANRFILTDQTAIFARPEPDAFAEAIVKALTDDGLRERLGAESRRLIEQPYNFGEFKRLLGACYEGLR